MAIPVRIKKIMPHRGLVSAFPADALEQDRSPRCLNVRFKFGEVRQTPGRPLLGDLPWTSESPLNIERFETVDAVTDWAVILTATTVGRWGNVAPGTPRAWNRITGPVLTGARRWGVTTGEDFFFFVHGTQAIARWDGVAADPYELIPASTGTVPVARYLEYFNNRLIAGYTVEGGTTFSNRIRWAVNGDHTAWDPAGPSGAGFLDLFEGREEAISGMKALHGRLVVYRGHSITEIIPTGDLLLTHIAQLRVNGNGVSAPYTLGTTGHSHIFMGCDFNVYEWDGTRLTAIGNPIVEELRALVDPSRLEQYFGVVFPCKQEYWLVLENGDAFIYDYTNNTWSRDSFPSITALGEVFDAENQLLWSTILTTWDTEPHTWESLLAVEFPSLFAGRIGGKTFKIDDTVAYDYYSIGSVIDRFVETPDFYFGEDPGSLGTLQRMLLLYEFVNNQPFEVGISFDRGSSWLTQDVTPTASGYTYVDWNRTGNVIRFRFRENNAIGRFRWRSYLYDFIPAGPFTAPSS